MARLRFRQFEKELSPIEQERGLSSYPAAPPPQQMVGNEVLRETRAYASLGKSLLDFGSTLGKIITNEQGRIRKEVWEQGLPLAYQELDEKLEQKIRDDYQWMTPAQVGEQWDSDLVHLLGDGEGKIGVIEESAAVKGITHEGDRKRLMALLRARASSVEMKVLRQQHGLENQLKESIFKNQVRDGLEEKLLEIQHHDFDHAGYDKDAFTEFLDKFTEDLIDDSHADNVPQVQKQRLELEITSEVNNWRNSALRWNYTIRQGIGAATWEGEGKEILETEAADDVGFRRRSGDETEDLRITKYRDWTDKGVELGYIDGVDGIARLARAELIIDTNDLKYDLENDPELAMARLSRVEFNTPENRIEYFAGYGFKIDENGNPTEGERISESSAFIEVKKEWTRLVTNGGKGYYPSIIKNRQAFYEEATNIVKARTEKDVGRIRQELRRLAEVLTNPNSDKESVAHAKANDRTSRHLGTRIPPWELEQWELVLKYAERVREGITDPINEEFDLHLKSRPELSEILETLDPDQLPQEEYGFHKDNYRLHEMRAVFGNTKRMVDSLMKAREEDPAAMGFGLIIKGNEDASAGEEVLLHSNEAIGIVVADQIRYNGGTQSMPTEEDLPRLIQNGTFSIWSNGLGKDFEETWGTFETGEDKQAFLLSTLRKYDEEWYPAVLQEMIKLEGFSRVDQRYMDITNPAVLNHLHKSQVNREALKEGSTRFFKSEDATVENIKKEIAFGSDGEAIREFLLSFYGQPAVQEELADAFVYYTIQLASKGEGGRAYGDVLGEEDENQASTYRHLIQSRYAVIAGGEGAKSFLRIPINELQGGVTAEDMQETLKEFTPNLLKLRKDDPAWNFVSGEEEAPFGDTLWQWVTNSDESGAILFFSNEQTGDMDVARYNKNPATLTWEQLRKLEPLNRPGYLSTTAGLAGKAATAAGEIIGDVVNPLIREWEDYQFFDADWAQFAAEEMDLQNTPAHLRPARRERITANRVKRAELKRLRIEENVRVAEQRRLELEARLAKEDEETVEVMGQVLEQAEAEETAPEGESPEDRRDRYTRMFWFSGNNREALTKKQIKRLMALDPEKAEVALQEIRRGGG